MSQEQQLRTVKKMIKAGMYDEARAALLSIDHPLADQWLKKLNKISPPKYKMASRNDEAIRRSRQHRSQPEEKSKVEDGDDYFSYEPAYEPRQKSQGNIFVVIVVLVGIGILLVGGAFMLTQTGVVEPPITTDETGCGGQEWVNAIDGSFNDLYRYNLWDMMYFDGINGPLSIDNELREQQIKELQSRLARIEDTDPPACMQDVRETMIETYETQIRATEILQPDDPLSAFGLFGKTLNLMKKAAQELTDLGAQFRRIDSEAINRVLDEDCPAFEYVTRTMYVDNQFVVMALVDPQIQNLQSYYSFVNDLSQQYYRVKDDPNVTPCLWEVRNQFVETIDAARSVYEAALGGDYNGMEYHADRMDTAWEQFYQEINKLGLDPNQFGYEVVIRD